MKKLRLSILSNLILFLFILNSTLVLGTQQAITNLKPRDYVIAGNYNITFAGITIGKEIYLTIEKNKTFIASLTLSSADKGKNFSFDGGALNLTITDILLLIVPEEYLLSFNVSVVGTIEVFRYQPPLPVKENVTEKICNPREKRCSNNKLEQCSENGTQWELMETCKYGCNITTLSCNPPPKEEIKKCEPCPTPTEWSECINGTQKRTNYRCSVETDFKCKKYEEERECKEGSYAFLAVGLALGCLIGLFLLIFSERVIKVLKRIK